MLEKGEGQRAMQVLGVAVSILESISTRKDGVSSCNEVVSSHKKWNLLVERLSLGLSERFYLGRPCGEHPGGEREWGSDSKLVCVGVC